MYKVQLLVLSLLLLSGCMISQPRVSNYKVPKVVDVRLEYVKALDTRFEIHVTFYEWTDLPGIVSELYTPDGMRLVEYFETPNGRLPLNNHDRHSAKNEDFFKYERWVYTYPARVEGVDTTIYGFGELPCNRTGSIVSNANPKNFNENYHQNHNRRGRIVEDMRSEGIWWHMYYDSKNKSLYFNVGNKPNWVTD